MEVTLLSAGAGALTVLKVKSSAYGLTRTQSVALKVTVRTPCFEPLVAVTDLVSTVKALARQRQLRF